MNAITCMKKYQHNWGCIKQELKKKQLLYSTSTFRKWSTNINMWNPQLLLPSNCCGTWKSHKISSVSPCQPVISKICKQFHFIWLYGINLHCLHDQHVNNSYVITIIVFLVMINLLFHCEYTVEHVCVCSCIRCLFWYEIGIYRAIKKIGINPRSNDAYYC